MIKNKRDFIEYIKEDSIVNKISSGPRKYFSVIFKFLYCLRKVEYYQNTNNNGIAFFFWDYMLRHYSVKTGITISPNCFGKGLYIPHYGCIIVNSSARFGDYCIVQCGVNVSEGVKGGNRIYIGAGAKILIDVSLADDIIIGANAVVTKSFLEPNIVLAGLPAGKISNKGMSSNRNKI
jgi:serine O-acetyltransferase